METQLEESLQMCTMLKQELEKVSVERTLLVREKENSQLLMLHLQNKMQMEEDMQMEDIHLKTKRMNKLEGERFQLQSKYEMLIARNEERDKLLKEKNNVIRNLKQGLQLSSLNNNNVGNISNNQFNGSEISNDKSSVADSPSVAVTDKVSAVIATSPVPFGAKIKFPFEFVVEIVFVTFMHSWNQNGLSFM